MGGGRPDPFGGLHRLRARRRLASRGSDDADWDHAGDAPERPVWGAGPWPPGMFPNPGTGQGTAARRPRFATTSSPYEGAVSGVALKKGAWMADLSRRAALRLLAAGACLGAPAGLVSSCSRAEALLEPEPLLGLQEPGVLEGLLNEACRRELEGERLLARTGRSGALSALAVQDGWDTCLVARGFDLLWAESSGQEGVARISAYFEQLKLFGGSVTSISKTIRVNPFQEFGKINKTKRNEIFLRSRIVYINCID